MLRKRKQIYPQTCIKMDTLIVGGGLAGLTVAEQLAKDGIRVTVLERYPAWGGRVATYREGGLQYEIGAGRIFKDHVRTHALIQRFGLHTYPISTYSEFEHTSNPFLNIFDPIHALLTELPPATLRQHTIAELVPVSYYPLLKAYPYWAEIHLLRADVALELFNKDKPMASKGTTTDFCGIREGIDSLALQLAKAAKEAGADMRNRHRVHSITQSSNGLFEIIGDYGKKAEANPFVYTAKRVIIATSRHSYKEFAVLNNLPLLKQLACSPLMRIYAIYPHNSDGNVWFHDIEKQVTVNPLRYIIPIDKQSGLIMISYTDGVDTNYWRPLEGAALEAAIASSVKALFPDMIIPSPTYLKKHDWPEGCTYWLPGPYSIQAAIHEAMNPSPNLYVVGESISLHQTWIEGALESADTLLQKIRTHI